MITQQLVIPWTVDKMEMPGLSEHAKMKMLTLGNVVRPKQTRHQLWEDNLMGCMGELVVSRHITGTSRHYYEHIEKTGSKLEGDGGTDIPEARVDIKTSLMRHGPDPLRYTLVVRPQWLVADTVYILNLCREYSEDGANGFIIGWLYTEELIALDYHIPNVFGDAYCAKYTHLHPFMNCRWEKQ